MLDRVRVFPVFGVARIQHFGKRPKEVDMHLLWWILVGLVAGWATGKIMKGNGYGFIADTLLGIVGAVVGGYIAGALGISPVGGLLYTILIAIVGAVIVVFLFRLIAGRRA